MWLLYLFGFLIVAGLYLMYLGFALPASAAVFGALYTVGLPVVYVAGLGKVLASRPVNLSAPRRWPKPACDGDPAVLQYFYGPAIADADHAVRVAYGSCVKLCTQGAKRINEAFSQDDLGWVTVPLGVGAAVGMAAGIAIGALVTICFALVHLAVVGILAAMVRITGAILRIIDSALLRIKNVQMVCPHCYERVPYPAYDCPGVRCGRRHRDVRPGKFGILRHLCQCGTGMNTLLLLGSSRMAAFCPHPGCEKSLEHRPGEAPEIVLPFFGSTGAGKTRLLFSMVAQLQRWADEGQLKAEFADSVTTRALSVAERLLNSGSSTTGTSVELPRANVIRLIVKKGIRILQMYDAAGERFYNTDRTQELRYLSKAQTFILVIDPLSVESFWQQLPADRQAELSKERSAAPSPELAYQQTYQQIEAMGVKLKKVRLAVVFSRADLIAAPDIHGTPQSSDVMDWARSSLGLGNLIRSTTQNFKETRFFRTAAIVDADGFIHESIAALMRWVLIREGVELPGSTP
jgi:hypothetical protein